MSTSSEHDSAATSERLARGFDTPGSFLSGLITRWWLIAIAVGLCLLVGFVYLVIAKSEFTASAVLLMEQPVGGKSAVPPDEFLATQKKQILATPAATSQPALRIRADKGQGTLTLSLDASSGPMAALRLSEIIEAYMQSAAGSRSAVTASWKDLAAVRDKLVSDRAAKERALLKFKEQANVIGSDADKAAADRLDQLQKALTSAQLEAANAKAAAAAAESLAKDPAQLRDVVDANRPSGIFDLLDKQKNQLQAEIATLEPQLEKQKETLLPQHPALVQTQKKIDQAKQKLDALAAQYADAYRSYVQRQKLTAEKKVEELSLLVDAQAKEAKTHVANISRHAELEAQLKSADAALAEAEKKLADAMTVDQDVDTPMRVVQPPRAPDKPSSPDARRIMLFAAAIGLIVGAALALASSRAR
jgi:uncharacterized protein involved in exopolysaccharide biosynthesis